MAKIKPPKYRPITSSDNASTTGLAVNPNGTYVANTYPQGNAAYGAQGQWGAFLPQVYNSVQAGQATAAGSAQLGQFALASPYAQMGSIAASGILPAVNVAGNQGFWGGV